MYCTVGNVACKSVRTAKILHSKGVNGEDHKSNINALVLYRQCLKFAGRDIPFGPFAKQEWLSNCTASIERQDRRSYGASLFFGHLHALLKKKVRQILHTKYIKKAKKVHVLILYTIIISQIKNTQTTKQTKQQNNKTTKLPNNQTTNKTKLN